MYYFIYATCNYTIMLAKLFQWAVYVVAIVIEFHFS